MAQQKSTKKHGQDAGGSPNDGFAKIKKRQENEGLSRAAIRGQREARRAAKAAGLIPCDINTDVAEIAILGVEDLVAGNTATGHQIQIGDSLFEQVARSSEALRLVSSTGKLSKFTDVNKGVFLPIRSLGIDEYTPKLSGDAGMKQLAMWDHITTTMTDDEFDELSARLKNPSARFDETSVESKKPAFEMVVANPDIWERASANPKIAFDGMGLGDQSPAEIRIFEENYGIVLGVFFGGHHNRTDGFTLRVGYVGDKAELAGKIRVGTALFCHNGRLPDSLSEMQVSSPFGESLQALFNFLFELDHKVKGPFMNEMYQAFGRLNSMRKELAMKKAPKQQPAATVPVVKTEVTPVIEVKAEEPSHAGKVVQLSVVKTEVAAPTSTQPSLKEIMQELLKGGVDAVTIAEAVMAYKQATTEPVTNAEQNAV